MSFLKPHWQNELAEEIVPHISNIPAWETSPQNKVTRGKSRVKRLASGSGAIEVMGKMRA